MFKAPSGYRIRKGKLASMDNIGNNGIFGVPAEEILYDDKLQRHKSPLMFIIVAFQKDGWEGISVCVQRPGPPRYPTHDELKKIRDLFWHGSTDNVFTYYPPGSKYKDDGSALVQLFCRPGEPFPVPSDEMMGLEKKSLIQKLDEII